MAYEATEWKNREVEHPRTFRQQVNADGTVTLTPEPGTIVEAGTPIVAANMNKMEQGIAEAHTELERIKQRQQWITPVLLDGWRLRTGHREASVAYRKDALDVVHLTGAAEGRIRENGLTIFELPVGYRPGSTLIFPAATGRGTGRVIVRYDGSIQILSTEEVLWVSFAGISFLAEP